jgi:serine/threonine protein kinase
MPKDPHRARELFLHAVGKLPPARWSSYLAEACGGDTELRRQVEHFLQVHREAGSFLERPAEGVRDTWPLLSAPTAEEPVGLAERPDTVIGPYKLIEVIGAGGMGTVWLAHQQEPVKRLVALKVIKPGMDSRQVLARFEGERQALALMDHPNIAKVLDAGATEAGRPYFVMELVKGVPLKKYCDERRLTPRQRLELFVPVCHAIQHAHNKGVIHRDIKASNVLVALYDGRPVPKVIDFGVAKATGQQLTEESVFTGFGAVVGTLEYMSPEQASFNQLDVDTRSDVYSLGVLLYELLTGTTPLEHRRAKEAGILESLRVIREEEVPTLSRRLSTTQELATIAADRGTEPTRLTRLVRGEPEWIVMKALEKDRERRYETANALAMDLKRYLADEPVQAGRPSPWYRLRKFIRRHRGPVLAAAVIVVVLVGGIVGTTLGLLRAEDARAAEEKQRGLAEASEREAKGQKEAAEAQKQRAIEFRDKALDALRAASDEDVAKLIGEKKELGPDERAYLEAIAKRWQAFADQEGDDEQAQTLRGEGHVSVAVLWDKLGRRDEAVAEYEKAEATLTGLAAQFPDTAKHQRDLAATLNNLAVLLKDLGRTQLAVTNFERARDIQQQLAGRYPAFPAYQQELAGTYENLGTVYAIRHSFVEARAAYERSRALREELRQRFPATPEYRRDLGFSHYNLAILLEATGRGHEARTEFESALRLREKLAETFPAVPSYRYYEALTHNSLGRLLAKFSGRPTAEEREQARVEFLQAINQQHQLVQEFPSVPRYQQGLAHARQNLGMLLKELQKWDEARQQYEQARLVYERLAAQFPTSPDYQRDLAKSRIDMGMLLTELGKIGEARDEVGRAVDVMTRLVEGHPNVVGYQLELGGYSCNLSVILLTEGKYADAVEALDRAIKTLTPLHEGRSLDARATSWLRNSHGNRAFVLARLGKYAAAVKDYDRAIELSPPPEQAKYRVYRATACLRAGLIPEAVAEVAGLTSPGAPAPGPGSWTIDKWYDFACVYAVAAGKVADRSREYGDRAMELLRNAVRAGYKDHAHMAKDADLDSIRGRDDFRKLLAELQAGKEKPKDERPVPRRQ